MADNILGKNQPANLPIRWWHGVVCMSQCVNAIKELYKHYFAFKIKLGSTICTAGPIFMPTVSTDTCLFKNLGLPFVIFYPFFTKWDKGNLMVWIYRIEQISLKMNENDLISSSNLFSFCLHQSRHHYLLSLLTIIIALTNSSNIRPMHPHNITYNKS